MKLAIATRNPAKINAILFWIENCIYLDEKKIEIISESVDSEVNDMPKSLEENILWAKNRAKNLKKNWIKADFYIWMEWWTNIVWEKAFLFWVVYIENKKLEWHIWVSPMMEVPEKIKKRIYEKNEILWDILWKVLNDKDASKKNWAFWAWSDDMLTRSDQFKLAFLCAISPFFNKFYK